MKIKHIIVHSRNPQKGVIEPIFFGILIAIALLTLASYGVQKVILSDSSSEVLNSGHRLIVKAVYDNYGSNVVDFSTLSNQVANDGSYAPDSWNRGGSSIINNVNGVVTLDGSTCNSVANGCFSTSQANLNSSLCKSHINTEFSRANTITVGSTTVKANATATLNPSIVGSACNNVTNTVVIQYSKF